jgi:hypothetical protein
MRKRFDTTHRSKEEIEKINKVLDILEERGIKLYVGACGCCESPWVSIHIDGEEVLKEQEMFNIDMIMEYRGWSR